MKPIETIMEIPQSIIKQNGIKVTTICKLGGVGLGYILPKEYYKNKEIPKDFKNVAWQSGGNGFYYPKQFKQIIIDSGKTYINKVNSLDISHLYKRI